ncbi:MAG: ABC transporter permease subunit [Opitutaceae bacterium]
MNAAHVWIIYRKELRDALRDRRTLISSIVVPTLLMPLLLFGVGKVMQRAVTEAREEVPAVAVLGGAGAPELLARLTGDARVRLVPVPPDWREAIAAKRLRAVVEVPERLEERLRSGEAAPAVRIFHYQGELKSENGARVAERIVAEHRERVVTERLAARGLGPEAMRPFEVRRENVAPPEKVGGNLFGGLVPYFIILLCFTGAIYPAMDITAGEKERGTMETLLCSPVARLDLVLGKFLLVLTGSLASMVFVVASMAGSALVGGAVFLGSAGSAAAGSLPPGAAAAGLGSLPTIDPWGLVGVFAMVLPVAVLFSAVALTVSLFAKSYKEAQSYLGPLIIVVLLPGMIAALPGTELTARTALIPLLNLSLVCKEMLSGSWPWGYIALIFGSSSLYAAGALALAVRMFNREDVLFRS